MSGYLEGQRITAASHRLDQLWTRYRCNPEGWLLKAIMVLEDHIAGAKPISPEEIRNKLDLLMDTLRNQDARSLEQRLARSIRDAFIEMGQSASGPAWLDDENAKASYH